MSRIIGFGTCVCTGRAVLLGPEGDNRESPQATIGTAAFDLQIPEGRPPGHAQGARPEGGTLRDMSALSGPAFFRSALDAS